MRATTDNWIKDRLPDSDMTVLVRIQNDEFPIWPGYHDGDCWRNADASQVEGRVIGWMELETAAVRLDEKGAA